MYNGESGDVVEEAQTGIGTIARAWEALVTSADAVHILSLCSVHLQLHIQVNAVKWSSLGKVQTKTCSLFKHNQ